MIYYHGFIIMVSLSWFHYHSFMIMVCSAGIDSSSLNTFKVIAIELYQNKHLSECSLHVQSVSLKHTECVDVHKNRMSAKEALTSQGCQIWTGAPLAVRAAGPCEKI